MKIIKGDYVLIVKSSAPIQQHLFDSLHPQGQFGKVIDVEQFYNRYTGKKLPLLITIRLRSSDGKKYHKETIINNIIKVNIK